MLREFSQQHVAEMEKKRKENEMRLQRIKEALSEPNASHGHWTNERAYIPKTPLSDQAKQRVHAMKIPYQNGTEGS